MPFIKAFSKSELKPGEGKCVALGGKRIAVFNVDGHFMAVDDRCTHDYASLAEGTVLQKDGRCIIECPWHGAHFDLQNGTVLSFPAVTPVKAYTVRIEGEFLEVEVNEPEGAKT